MLAAAPRQLGPTDSRNAISQLLLNSDRWIAMSQHWRNTGNTATDDLFTSGYIFGFTAR
jgi:hypothetical protein